jgi:hypothetical protein
MCYSAWTRPTRQLNIQIDPVHHYQLLLTGLRALRTISARVVLFFPSFEIDVAKYTYIIIEIITL